MKEALRLLKPGGVLAFADNNPQSLVTHNLPPWLYSLLRSTEPWSDEYSLFDVEACLKQVWQCGWVGLGRWQIFKLDSTRKEVGVL